MLSASHLYLTQLRFISLFGFLSLIWLFPLIELKICVIILSQFDKINLDIQRVMGIDSGVINCGMLYDFL